MAFSNRTEWAWLYRENRPFALYQVGSLVCITVAGAAALVQPLLMKWMIDDVLPKRLWGGLIVATALYFLMTLVQVSLTSLGAYVRTLAVQHMQYRTRLRLVRRVQSLPVSFHEKHPVGDLLQRLERDVIAVGDFASEVLPSLVRLFVDTTMAVAVMFYLDWRLSSIVLPLLPILGFARHRYRVILRQGAESVRDASGRQSSLLQEMLGAATQVQLLGAERRLAREFGRLHLRTMRAELGQRQKELTYRVIALSIIGVGAALVVGYGGMRVLTGGLTIGGLVAFGGYIGRIFAPINTSVGLFARLIRVYSSVRRLIELEQAPDGIVDAPDAVPLNWTPRVLTLRNVCLDFASDRRPVLRGADFQVCAGERVAVVGQSGCGKSSLMKLIPRLYDPTTGSVEIDGVDVRTLQVESLRRAISYVPQEPVLFRGTLRANLRFACPAATIEELDEAAWIACLTDVIARLPQGWHTELGSLGAGLSGGEKQRFAIARALLQRRPILILDEGSSALDTVTERLLLSRLEQWANGRMVIFVTHRLAAAEWARRVVVLSQGEVVEDATHDVLTRDARHYRALRDTSDHTPVVAASASVIVTG